MLFRAEDARLIAVSQPMHAWISGTLLRAWSERMAEPILLAAEQHDIAWLGWETEPTFDAATGRPHLFLDVGGAAHAPMWARGVEHALGAWGAHVALLLSRHGAGIYRRLADRFAMLPEDARATQHYMETQTAKQAAWAGALGLDAAELERQSALITFVDVLSLALCGALKAPLDLRAPGRDGAPLEMRLTERVAGGYDFVLTPWAFRERELVLEGEGLVLPSEGRFADEAAMRRWLEEGERVGFRARLSAG